MGQSVTLYRVNTSDFFKIEHNPEELNIINIAIERKTFEKCFEGLRFVLSKNQDDETMSLVQ